jgi:hypothetical protein
MCDMGVWCATRGWRPQIVLRDVMDNGAWGWLEAKPEDAVWVREAVGQVEELKAHEDFGYEAMRTTLSNSAYKRMRREFLGAADTEYYATGAQVGAEYFS